MKAKKLFLWAAIAAPVSIPELSSPVLDEATLYSVQERDFLEAQIRSFVPEVQFQVWTVPSLEGTTVEELSMKAAEKWKLGGALNDNGLLLLIAPKDRKMRIEVGQGLEGSIPDVVASRTIREIMTPHFREGLYFEGTRVALERLYTRATGKVAPEQNLPKELQTSRRGVIKGSPSLMKVLIFIFIFIFVFLFSAGNRVARRGFRRSGWVGGGGWGGSGGSWGGGGGGWSGGGGGFSGGGSSGSW